MGQTVIERRVSGPTTKVLVFPRSSNPYQQELYTAMSSSGPIVVRYLDGPTPSQTLNLLALPVLLVIARVRGFRILHIHWVYSFGVAWANGRRARRLVERWYSFTLTVASALGLKIVWTAHNLLPHEPVFVDDVAARRQLIRRCDAVIAHHESAASVVRGWGARRASVVPGGVSLRAGGDTPTRSEACAALGVDPAPTRALFFGSIRDYKGVDLLLDAIAELDPDLPLHVAVVGQCHDPGRRATLRQMAEELQRPERLSMRLDFVPDDLLATHLTASDFGVFPFRSVTNSSSVLHALAAGLPVIIPSLATLEDVPEEAALRYAASGGSTALAGALATAALLDPTRRSAMAMAAIRHASSRSWPAAAAATWTVFDEMLAPGRRRGSLPATVLAAEVAR